MTLLRAVLDRGLCFTYTSAGARESFAGDHERLADETAFAVRIGDATLEPSFPKGGRLAFARAERGQVGEIVVLRGRTTGKLALRRTMSTEYAPLCAAQAPISLKGGEWRVVGRLIATVRPEATP